MAQKLFIYAKKIGITIFSTPFSEEAVEFLEKLNCPFYKVASFEMTDIPLIEKIASTKPMIISTGMANLNEIKKTVAVAKKHGAKQIILLYCVSNYPSSIKDFSLNNITTLIKKFKCSLDYLIIQKAILSLLLQLQREPISLRSILHLRTKEGS